MKHQTNIAAVMLISSSLLCVFILWDIAYPAILCVLGLLGLRRKIILAIQPERRVLSLLILLFLLVLFGIHYWYFTWPAHSHSGPESSMAWHTVTRYFLASMVLMLFLGMPDELPQSFGFFFIATMVSAGQTFLMQDKLGLFRALEIVSVILLLLYASLSAGSPLRHLLNRKHVTSHGPRLFVLAILFVTVNMGWVLGSVLYQNPGAITILGNLWKNQGVLLTSKESASQLGFSRSGKLGTINDLLTSDDLEITLRVTSSLTPGYLRAQTFDSYLKGQWHSRSLTDSIGPDSTRVDLSLGNRVGVYRIRDHRDSHVQSMVIKHVLPLGDATFLPLNASELAIRGQYLMIDDDFVIFRPHVSRGTAYAVKYSQNLVTKKLSRTHRGRSLRLASDVEKALEGLATSLFKDCVSTQDKIKATTDYFDKNYTYSLVMPESLSADPLIHFIKEGKTGYCEYFASGAALLLRLGGVPTRYVTGFHVTEKDSLVANTWVARHQDAHAWVEAWDDQYGNWRIVEATVQNALEDALANASANDRGLQRFAIIQHLMQALYQFGVLGILVWLYIEGGLLFQFLLSLAIALGVVLVVRKIKQKGQSRHGLRPLAHSAQWQSLHKMQARLDRRLKRKGLRRQPHETLLTFSQSLTDVDLAPQPAASIQQWYAEYNHLRYGKGTTAGQLETLTQTLGRVLREFRGKAREEEAYSK
jgi:transglutaminase-like putative cysteine protease